MSETFDRSASFKLDRFLYANYASLARPTELCFLDGRLADGFFAGLLPGKSLLLIRNFCFRDADSMDEVKQVSLTELTYFIVKGIFIPPKRR